MSAVAAYLAAELGIGAWPRRGLVVLPSPLRARPGWGAWRTPLLGVHRGEAAVLSVAPSWFARAARWAQRVDPAEAFTPAGVRRLRAALRPLAPGAIEAGPLLYCTAPRRRRSAHAVLALRPTDPRLPAWARGRYDWRCFAVLADGRVASVAAVKAKSPRVWEIAVATEAPHRGRGMATAVVAAATRAIVATGRVPVYVHAHGHEVSAQVARAVGYRVFGTQVWVTR